MKKVIKPEDAENYSKHMNFYHPPLLPMPDVPVCLHHGSFLAKRRHDVHTGVDLYTPPDSKVYAIERGEVVAIRAFTGKIAGYPFWNDTWAVDIESQTGIVCYGEIKPAEGLKEGQEVELGQIIGKVIPVLKKYKGKPMSMLHMALHRHGWKYLYQQRGKEDQEIFYDMQIDPTLWLIQLKNLADKMQHDDNFRHEVF